MMNETFPLMQTMYHSEATTATECQDLMGMSFRTVHFDGSQSTPLGFTYSHGSNVRHISVMDPAAATAIIKMQLPGPEHDGPSGLFASDPNLLLQWVQNQPFDYAFGHQVDGQAVAVQGFTAQ